MVDETPQRVAVVLSGKKDAFDLFAISELDFSTCRKRNQQRHQVTRDLLLGSQQMFLEVPNASELDATLGHTRCVDGQSQFVVLVQESQSDDGSSFDAFAVAVASAKGADWIKTLQRETRRINSAVTYGTSFDAFVFFKCCLLYTSDAADE